MANPETFQARYLNPLTDFGFKTIFGQKDIMMAFLNDLLEPKSPIAELTFIDKEIGAEVQSLRGVVYDMFCTTEDGEEFIVEMQNKSQQFFSDRIIYYLSRSVSMQVEKNMDDERWNYKLRPVYGIFLLNFHMKGFEPRSVRRIEMKVSETNETFTDKIRAFTLELPSFKNQPESIAKTKIEYWLYNLANMEHMTSQLPFQNEQPIFNRVGNISEIAHMTKEERIKYNVSLDTFRTSYAIMLNERAEGVAEGMEKGMEMGMEKGREEGREEERKKAHKEKLASARSLKSLGSLTIKQIANALGLTDKEVEEA